ncbi:MAG: ester cyclase [Tabrizicola sp.]|nr:ester cyclase [Tabrizicola sp.]
MPDQSVLRDLFDRWEKVWHEGRYDLLASCVAESYGRHDEFGDRTVSRDAYAAEIAKVHEARPGIRIVVYDHTLDDDRAWFRFAFTWPDPETGKPMSRAGLQQYRIEAGKLAETWVVLQSIGSTWPDPVAQVRWTEPTAR